MTGIRSSFAAKPGKGIKTMRRRQFLSLLGGAAAGGAAGTWPVELRAATKIARVGIIDDGPDWEPFRQELHDLNYVQGQNIVFDYRRGDGMPDRWRPQPWN
jgi:hypothetical protein